MTATNIRSDPAFPPWARQRAAPRSAASSTAALLLALALLAGCGDSDEQASDRDTPGGDLTAEEFAAEPPGGAGTMPRRADGEPTEIGWDALIPEDWRPGEILAQYDVDDLADDDPRALELMERLETLWAEAPVVESLARRQVRLPGFVVPLDHDDDAISEFLLVPYFGACIHVPPPPANQTVLVTTAAGDAYAGGLFDTVWVEGRMRVEPFSDELGDAGYHIEDARVSIYEEP
jgi:hypothetical protein